MSDILPLVTVIIPTYNYALYIKEAIGSILQQNYPGKAIEIIVVDDGSTDDTKQVLQPFVDSGKIRYYYQQNKGKANATAFGIQNSNGEYIFNLDADDCFLPDKISASVAVFESDNSIVHVASPALCQYEDGVKASGSESLPEAILKKPLDGNWLLDFFYTNKILFGGGSTFAARASVLKSIAIPDGVDMYIDEFLLLALLPLGKSYFVEEPLSVWRIHTNNYSGKTVTMEQKVNKGSRLLQSSSAVLAYIKANNYRRNLIKIYQLQHATREIYFKETLNNKTITDILKYSATVFLGIRPGLKQIIKYHVLNRLVPSGLFRFIKKHKTSNV